MWRWPVRIAGAIAVALVLGLLYQLGGDLFTSARYPPPGRLVDVGGWKLHLVISGDVTTSPPLVLDAAEFSASPQWGWIQTQLARTTRVVSYDRPGLGWSDASPSPLAPRDLARILRTALDAAGVKGPYVLAGHGNGALFAQEFAIAYPQDAVALVLIDPRVPDLTGVLPPDVISDGTLRNDPLALAGRFGIVRATGLTGRLAEGLPPRSREEAGAIFASTHHLSGVLPDMRLGDLAARELRATKKVGELPILIIRATDPDPFEYTDKKKRDTLNDFQAQLTSLSPKTEQKVVIASDRHSIVTDPGYARAVADHIRTFLGTLRIRSQHDGPVINRGSDRGTMRT